MVTVVARDDDAPSKRALLESALRLFVSAGMCETTIRDVAEDAGFTNPAIFKFFKNRDELARCVFERCYERLAAELAAAEVPGFEARARAIVAVTTAFIDRDLDAFLFVTEQLRRFWPEARQRLKRKSILRMLGDLFAVGVEERKVSPDHDPALLVAATVGLFSQFARGLYFREIGGPAAKRAPELERMILRIGW